MTKLYPYLNGVHTLKEIAETEGVSMYRLRFHVRKYEDDMAKALRRMHEVNVEKYLIERMKQIIQTENIPKHVYWNLMLLNDHDRQEIIDIYSAIRKDHPNMEPKRVVEMIRAELYRRHPENVPEPKPKRKKRTDVPKWVKNCLGIMFPENVVLMYADKIDDDTWQLTGDEITWIAKKPDILEGWLKGVKVEEFKYTKEEEENDGN